MCLRCCVPLQTGDAGDGVPRMPVGDERLLETHICAAILFARMFKAYDYAALLIVLCAFSADISVSASTIYHSINRVARKSSLVEM